MLGYETLETWAQKNYQELVVLHKMVCFANTLCLSIVTSTLLQLQQWHR